MKSFPLFNQAETERVALFVGFNPNRPGPARDFFRNCDYPPFPDGITERQRQRATFYIALGAWVHARYIEPGRRIPPDVEAWYELNTALSYSGLFTMGLLE